MNRIFVPFTLFVSLCPSASGAQPPNEKDSLGHEMSYWFDAPVSSWESESMPIGNGRIGANVFGTVGTEHLTFNEKSLWRGGSNTRGGEEYYWDMNKDSAHLLDAIRQAFLDGDEENAAMLARTNFNGLAAYGPIGEHPFRFSSDI